MFERLLIANRGEIACRVMRTARRMGVRTIAVYSEADAGARHVREADEALLIGPAPAAESYLAIDRVIAAARRSGAQAVHPGYGFLSENEDFADACAAAGLIFVGPSAAAIRAMGSKSGAKALMEKAGVPLVPGYHGENQDAALLAREADRIGFPILIKPSAGGGGKGMRVVESAAEFEHALTAARREAKSAFGDDQVLLEKYLRRPRHIEIQVFGDSHGNCVHLFARDCSVQRRHQKVVEEAPAPGLSDARMHEMGEAAVAVARAVDYVGAGTVEFIAEGDSFHFMEMNTRLQVEHPVTEMVTGLDLVEWQLRVAAGEPLPLRQEEIVCRGHAVEVRLYAEDPRRDFLPSVGKLIHVNLPPDRDGLRVDIGFGQGDTVSAYYDPMLAKVIAWGEDRPAALRRLVGALEASAVVGVANNLSFLAAILRHSEFAAGPVDTGFIGREMEVLAPPRVPASDAVLVLGTLAVIADRTKFSAGASDPRSPWSVSDGWQLSGEAVETLRLREGEREVAIGIRHLRGGALALSVSGTTFLAHVEAREGAALTASVDGHRVKLDVVHEGQEIWVFRPGGPALLHAVDPLSGGAGGTAGSGHLTAPMPGTVVAVSVRAGDSVTRGARLMVVEAMKMEHAIVAPADGTVAAVRFAVGDKVGEGEDVIDFESATEEPE
jgi:3-methylcrotonyl-CoA carboxylase alpha subunit